VLQDLPGVLLHPDPPAYCQYREQRKPNSAVQFVASSCVCYASSRRDLQQGCQQRHMARSPRPSAQWCHLPVFVRQTRSFAVAQQLHQDQQKALSLAAATSEPSAAVHLNCDCCNACCVWPLLVGVYILPRDLLHSRRNSVHLCDHLHLGGLVLHE
jgi:hypothetical protein